MFAEPHTYPVMLTVHSSPAGMLDTLLLINSPGQSITGRASVTSNATGSRGRKVSKSNGHGFCSHSKLLLLTHVPRTQMLLPHE